MKLKINKLLKIICHLCHPKAHITGLIYLYLTGLFVFCGGDCAEDLGINIRPGLHINPFIKARKDGQINLFTGEAFNYQAILTNDFSLTDNQVVCFYNARGACEREFDELKNDFGWRKMPFSKMEQNSVFLFLIAMSKNLYNHMID